MNSSAPKPASRVTIHVANHPPIETTVERLHEHAGTLRAGLEASLQKERKRMKMKETAADAEVRESAYRKTAGELRSFVERVEKLEADKADLASDVKDVYAEAKGRGYDTKALREVIKIRRQDSAERAEQQAVIEVYLASLSIQP